MTEIEETPLPEPEPEQKSKWLPPSLPAASTPDIEPETALVPDSGIIEGEFTDIIPAAPAQTAAAKPLETAKRKLSPAMLALIAILGLFALCCLMAIIIFFMVYPTARDQSAALIPLVVSALAG